MDRDSYLSRAVVISAIGALISMSLTGCAYLQQPRRWGTCALVGGIVGAGAGAGIGTAINENTGDHENGVAFGLGGGAIGAGLGALAGHYICDPVITLPPAPPPPPPPLPPPPPPPPVKEKIVLRGVHFDFDKYNIRPGDAAILDEAAATLQANPNVTVNVNGHTDAIGTEE